MGFIPAQISFPLLYTEQLPLLDPHVQYRTLSGPELGFHIFIKNADEEVQQFWFCTLVQDLHCCCKACRASSSFAGRLSALFTPACRGAPVASRCLHGTPCGVSGNRSWADGCFIFRKGCRRQAQVLHLVLSTHFYPGGRPGVWLPHSGGPQQRLSSSLRKSPAICRLPKDFSMTCHVSLGRWQIWEVLWWRQNNLHLLAASKVGTFMTRSQQPNVKTALLHGPPCLQGGSVFWALVFSGERK